jgi:hypothetical protein
MRRLLLVGLLAFTACGPQDALLLDEEDVLDVADAPLLGADGKDAAERSCHVVLRTLDRGDVRCSSGLCWWSWTGTVDLSAQAVAEGAKPGVLFKNQDAKSWSSVTPAKVSGAPAGFQRYRFTIWRNTVRDGMSATAYARASVEVAPFVRTTTGARLFDHNRNPGEFDNYVLNAAGGWRMGDDPAACGATPPAPAKLVFGADWQTRREGALVAGRSLVIDYALERLTTCRGTHNGYPAWDVRAFVRFSPSGEVAEGSVRGFNSPTGTPSNSTAVSVPFTARIPAGTTGVEVWFRNSTGAGSTCEAWDSNQGANYRFAVEPRALPPVAWVGNGGSSFTRLCSRQDGVPQDVVLDSYLWSRACTFVTADVYVPGVTDAAEQRPWAVFARASMSLDGQALPPRPLAFVGRVGNDYRYQFEVPRAELYSGPRWTRLSYTLEFSTDGITWAKEPTRTVTRDASVCNPAWGSCAP